MSFIVAESISKSYGNGNGVIRAIEDVSFQIPEGDFISLMGESGAGKSTLLSMMGAMNTPTQGRLWVDDIDIYQLNREQRADFRREFLGFIFQNFHLMPYLTVSENVMLPLATIKMPRTEKQKMAQTALSQVGLADKGDRLPGQISGGEKERVAIARAIVNNPPVLLADEPTGNLDTKTSGEIMALLQMLNDQGMTIIMVTHSHACAAFAGRKVVVSDGRLL